MILIRQMKRSERMEVKEEKGRTWSKLEEKDGKKSLG